jgi:hypothetical protein
MSLPEPNPGGEQHHILWPIHDGMRANTGFTVVQHFAAGINHEE